MELNTKRVAVIFKALCDENRIQTLQLLQNGERCACDLLEEKSITQPTLSHNMKDPLRQRIVEVRKEGKWMHYSISKEGTEYARKRFDFLTEVKNAEETQSCCKK